MYFERQVGEQCGTHAVNDAIGGQMLRRHVGCGCFNCEQTHCPRRVLLFMFLILLLCDVLLLLCDRIVSASRKPWPYAQGHNCRSCLFQWKLLRSIVDGVFAKRWSFLYFRPSSVLKISLQPLYGHGKVFLWQCRPLGLIASASMVFVAPRSASPTIGSRSVSFVKCFRHSL